MVHTLFYSDNQVNIKQLWEDEMFRKSQQSDSGEDAGKVAGD